MKTFTLTLKGCTLFLCALLFSSYTYSQVTVANYDFESGIQGWTDGGDDAAYLSNASWACGGSGSVYSKDDDTSQNYLTSPVLDLTGYSSVDFSLCLKTLNLSNGEGFDLLYYNGSSWSTVQTFLKGTDFTGDGNGVSTSLSANLSSGTYTFSASSRFRLSGNGNGNSDYNVFDNILVEGYPIVSGPEINIRGNGTAINDGDTTPNVSDDTDFGNVSTITSSANTFTIENQGSSTLTLSGGSPYVTISGTHAADFSVTAIPSNSIASSGSTTFEITFTPGALGLRTASISISSNDSDENPYNFSIQGTGVTPSYCSSNGNNTNDEYIGRFQLNAIDNSSGVGTTSTGYSDFTAISTDLDLSTNYAFTITPTWTGSMYDEGYAIWVDYNQDYDFDDAGELVFSQAASTTTPVTGSFTIPGSATLGTTRMRVSMKYNGIPSQCESFGYGEVEDYTVNILSGTPTPEINITGNGVNIVDGDTTPDVADDTDFGNVVTAGGTQTHTFTIENIGSANLNLTGGSPYVTISGTNAADFSIAAIPSTPISASGSTTFQITFDPSANGLRTASISIANDDSDENPYNFNIQGTGYAVEPEINIQGNSTTINDGDTTPTLTDNTDFGNVVTAAGTSANTFTIQNTGVIDLLLTGGSPYITISGTNAADFTLTTIPSGTIVSSSSTTFQITFDPSADGIRTASVSIANNDSDENPYNFDIRGTGYTPPPCGSTVLHTADFESGLDGWTSGGIDASRVNNTTWSYGGSYSLRVRDDDAAGSASSFDSPAFDFSNYDKVDFKFFFAPNSMDSTYDTSSPPNKTYTEEFIVEYSSDNGSSWTPVQTFESGQISNQSADFETSSSAIFYGRIVTLKSSVYTFPAATTSRFRIRCDASDDDDQIYIDNITITGVDYCTPTEAPGGVTSNLDLWLKADMVDGVSESADGSLVSEWIDNGKGNNAEVMDSGLEPVYRNNTSRNINFNPVIDFTNDLNTAGSDLTYISDLGSRDVLSGTAGFNSSDMFVVVVPDVTITNTMWPADTFTSTDPTANDPRTEDVTGFGYGGYSSRFTNEYFGYCIGTHSNTTGAGYGRADTSGTTNFNQTGIINIRHNAAVNDMDMYINDNAFGNLTADAASFATVDDTRYWLGRSQYFEGSFDGRIAEVITYSATNNDSDLTQARNRIQSYLAVKYGITLGVNGTSQDYVDSDGTVIWDQSANSGYNYDIAGIGRDDDSELNQKQSRSVNDASDGTGRTQGLLTIGLADIYNTNTENKNTNPTTFNDKEFLMWGNNGADINLAASVISVNMSSGITPSLNTDVTFTGMQRIWKVVENGGDIPTVKVRIPQNAIRNISPPGNYYMFISSTGVFDPTADYRVMTADGSGNLETEYDFDGTRYITFGYAPQVEVVRSVYFDGSADYIDVEDNLDLDPTGFTISAWVKRDAADSGTKSILSKRDLSFTQGYDLRILNDNRIEMYWKNGTNQITTSNASIPDDEWHHVAVIYDGSNASLYIDGVLDISQGKTAPTNTTDSFLVAAAGKGTTTQHFRGNIDEVRVWDTTLTEDQLRFVMNQEIDDNAGQVMGVVLPTSITKHDINAVPWSDLAGYYPMSVYTYTNTDDASGNGNQGALRNLDTVDRQTAPLPYESTQNGDWDTNSTWTNGSVQYMPGSASIADPTVTVDWNIVRTSHNVTMDNTTLPAGNNENRNVLGLYVDANELTLDGDNATNAGSGLTVSHYLSLTGKIDLEGDSQLIQTEDSDLLVATNGELEKDQQGTADTYTYNYWSSPVGDIDTATNNYRYTVQDVMFDGTNPVNFSSSGYNGAATTPIRIADYWIWKFANLTSDDYSAWQHVRRTGTIYAGEGFTMKGPDTGGIFDDQNYVFLGKPNNGDISLTINSGNDYLVGNPYASSLDADQFILDNPNTTGALQFWEHWGGGSHALHLYQGGYAIYNLSGGVPAPAPDPDVAQVGVGTKTPGRYVPVSQGFFVTGISAGTINFENDQRAFTKEGGSSSVFMRTAKSSNSQNDTVDEEVDDRMKFRIGFKASNDLQLQRELLLTIDENTTEGVDWAYDAHLNEDQTDDMFWMIGDEKFIIQANDNANLNTVYPLGVKTSVDGTNSFTIRALENVPNEVNIYLHDKALNISHDLRISDYQIFLNAGEYLDRFEITFKIMAGSLGIDDQNVSSLDVLYSNDKEKIVLINPNLIEVKSIELFNMLGQSVQKIESISESGYSEYDVKNLSTGTYVIKLYTVSGSVSTKKVLVK